jgi:hypothetical protein
MTTAKLYFVNTIWFLAIFWLFQCAVYHLTWAVRKLPENPNTVPWLFFAHCFMALGCLSVIYIHRKPTTRKDLEAEKSNPTLG